VPAASTKFYFLGRSKKNFLKSNNIALRDRAQLLPEPASEEEIFQASFMDAARDAVLRRIF